MSWGIDTRPAEWSGGYTRLNLGNRFGDCHGSIFRTCPSQLCLYESKKYIAVVDPCSKALEEIWDDSDKFKESRNLIDINHCIDIRGIYINLSCWQVLSLASTAFYFPTKINDKRYIPTKEEQTKLNKIDRTAIKLEDENNKESIVYAEQYWRLYSLEFESQKDYFRKLLDECVNALPDWSNELKLGDSIPDYRDRYRTCKYYL